MSKDWEFPAVESGDLVLFQGTLGTDKVFPMIVESVGDDTVDGAVWNGENSMWEQRSGCRHVRDPWLQDPFNANVINEEHDTGVFLLSPTAERMDRKVNELTDAVEVCLELLRKGGKEPDKAIAAAKSKKDKAKADKKQEGGKVNLNDLIGLRAPAPTTETADVN